MSDRSEHDALTAENLRQSILKKKIRKVEEAATRRNAADVQMEEMFKCVGSAPMEQIRLIF